MRNLIGRLLERSPAELDRIAAAWGVTLAGRDRYTDVAAIYREITDIWAARDIWGQLPEVAHALVVAMGRHADETRSPEELAEELEHDQDEVREALRNLYRFGIVSVDQAREPECDEEPAQLYLPREMWTIFERVIAEQRNPLDLDAPLDELFATTPFVEIEEAATCWGARVTPGLHARAELINVIRAQIERPERVEREIGRLTQPARALWQSLRDAGGSLPYDELEAASGLRQPAFRPAARELGTRLLVWHVYAGGNQRLLGIPDGILHPRTPEPEPVPDLASLAEDEVYEAAWVFPQSAAWDLLTVLREAVRGGPRWSGLMAGDPALQRRLADWLWRAELETGVLPTGYLGFIARIGALLGVLQEHEGRAGPGPESETWRQAAFTTAARRMVAAWTTSDDWIEGRDRIELAMYGASWPAFRATLLRALADLDEDIWYEQERFVERLIASEPDLLRQAQVGATPATQLTMRVDGRQRPEERRADVMRLVIDTTLETACLWLNLIERSHRIEDRRPVIRLTPFGRWVGGRRGEPAGQHLGPAPLAIGANLQILLYRPTPRRVWALTAFSEPRALDRVSTFGLTASAVIRALASNVQIEDIIRFLESQSGEPLPQTVLYTLEEWDRGYHRVWLQRAVLLTPEDEEDQQRIVDALREIGLDPQLLPDGRIALVHDASDATERLFDTATRALRERGFAALSRPPEPRSSGAN